MKFEAGIALIVRLQKCLGRLIKSTGFWAAVSVGVVIAVGASVSVEYWVWLQGGTAETTNTAAVRNIALVVGGIVAILIALWRSVVAERQATAARQQSETAERSYLSERYRQAASMLGHSEITVRLGGIYTLERLAEDYPAEFQYEAFKLLLEFVRTPPALQQSQPKVWDGWLQLERPATRPDVQEAIRVIGKLERLPRNQDDTGLLYWMDLRGAQLCGVELYGLRLNRAHLENANLMYARLEDMDLTGAQLQWANCRQALVERADLSGAEMSDADFSGVKARNSQFRGAMMPAKMIDADLEQADLTEAKFPNTDLTGAELRGANMSGENLRGRVYWIDRAGLHEAEENAVRITQEQLDEAVADPERPPTLSVRPVGDAEPRTRLVWRGKAPPSDAADGE